MMQIESFKAADVVTHFNQLKSTGNEQWWNNYVSFEWSRIRTGKNSTKWITLKYTPSLDKKPTRFSIIIRDEVHSGQIMPNTPEEVIELKTRFPDANIILRTMKPSLQFQKWSKQVPTQEDRITPVIDDNGNPVVPDDKFLSNYYQVAYYIDEIFRYEMKLRTERATFMVVALSQNKTASVKEIRASVGHVNDCDTIMRDDEANTIREKYPDKYIEIMKGVLTVSSTKVGTIIQERISDKALKNKGEKLPNPMTRITIPFDTKTGAPQLVTILDKTKPFKLNGKRGYENATYNAVPINANNIHNFIPSRSIIDGVISMDSVCFSQLGISLPIKATLVVVQQPINRENNVFAMCNEIYGEEFDDDVNVFSDCISVSSNKIVQDNDVNESLLSDLSV